ncbi:helix-turn-helix transcriptional regulator [Cysteiniphilum sp. 6C5]|uniref:helix-turn-helix transcriptional regulator n=1 Tax=unclassified Cysteiniphilum TaxID=2610889 RepID=UPI003F86F526
MAKTKSTAKINNINPIRGVHLSIVPLNQLEKLSERGYCLVMLKQEISDNLPFLTGREKECLKHFINGLPTKEIAQNMLVNDRTVRLMLESLRHKLEVQTNNALIAKVFQMGWDTVL